MAARIRQALRSHPIAALIGPRQCGKTTLARQIAEAQRSEFFDLEHPVSLERLANPMTSLEPLQGLVVLDEVQRKPELFPILRMLADRKPAPARFLLLGSASPDLIRESSETLAGRIAFIDMAGFDLAEVGESSLRGEKSYPLMEKAEAVSIFDLTERLGKLAASTGKRAS